jgi:hypothetical protein
MNALLTHLWTRAVRDFSLAGRLMHRPPLDEDLRRRVYPPRSSSYLDDNLMNREMRDHLRKEPIRFTSRLAFRLRRS